jgi:hypothetical protein
MVAERGRPIYRTHGSYRLTKISALSQQSRSRTSVVLLFCRDVRACVCVCVFKQVISNRARKQPK